MAAVVLAGGAAPVGAQQPADSVFARLADEYVRTSLAFSPTSAVSNGLHRFTDPTTGRVVDLDVRLDDVSRASEEAQRRYYRDVARRLAAIDTAALTPQARADHALLSHAVRLQRFQLETERGNHWRPQSYPELLGSALFAPISLEYADTATRAAHLAARLEQAPAFLAAGRKNLEASNGIHRGVALEELGGVVALVRETGAAFVRGTPSAGRYARAQGPALAALERFTAFVRDTLPTMPQVDWRMGEAKFAAKWRDVLQVSATPHEARARAEARMRDARAEMLALARPLHDQWFPGHRHPGGEAGLNGTVGEVLARIGEDHADRDSLLVQARRDAAALVDTVRAKRLLSLDDFSNLRLIDTPEFMRGSYGVAGAVFAPAFEPGLATFYWVTPIPRDWAPERAEAKLREYNRFKMLTLTAHEAIPGHTTQGTYANMVLPEWRRVLRSVLGNGPYIEGWGVYAEHLMLAAGVDGGDPVKARLTELKGMLRVYANAIIDVGLHVDGMSGDEAVRLMMEQAFQERPEAEGKLQRAQLDYVQLNMYFAGIEEWEALRRDVERAEGPRFDACRFHDRVLLYGALPLPTIRALYFAGVAPEAKGPADRCGAPRS